jgi:hypothetical protein
MSRIRILGCVFGIVSMAAMWEPLRDSKTFWPPALLPPFLMTRASKPLHCDFDSKGDRVEMDVCQRLYPHIAVESGPEG